MRIVRAAPLAFCFILFTLILHARQADVLSRAYKPAFTESTIKAFLDDIAFRTGISFSYSNASVDLSHTVTLTGKEQTVNEVLTTILTGQHTRVISRRNKILLVPEEKGRKPKVLLTTLNGYVKEAGSKEALPGAVVFIPSLKVGTVTNSYGYYSLSVPPGNYELLCTYIGYNTDTSRVSLKDDYRKDLLLSVQNALEEVKVTANRETRKDHLHLTYSDIKERPSLLGENDVLRALQNYSGVTGTMEGSNKIVVRGGDPGQNLHLIDGVPLYHIDHFSGFTSVFNSEALKSADFYKGSFPAKYGGRLSSVIDINSKDGNMERWGGQFSLGLLKGSVNLEGPLVKDKSSIMISLRRTWIDALWRFTGPAASQTKIDFYDLNVKANYILSKNDRVYVSIYNGRDQIKVNPSGYYVFTRWGNSVGSVKWNRIINPKTFLNTTVTYSNFRFSLAQREDIIDGGVYVEGEEYKGASSINDAGVTTGLTWYPNTKHKVETGIHYSYAKFVPVQLRGDLLQLPVATTTNADKFNSNEVTMYAEDEIKVGTRWILRPGLHFANWFSKKFNYSSLQPRMYASYKVATGHTVYASVSQMAQFLHLISNNTFGLPSDFWIPSTSEIEPEESYMGTLGYSGSPLKGLSYNVELYYKDIKNVTAYAMGKDLFDNVLRWEDNITQGHGESYGAEFSLTEKIGDFTFRGAYTWSRTWRQFPELNGGKRFPYRYDRRHNIRAAAIYKPSKRFEASANWTYMSGEAMTLPDQLYPDLDQSLMIRSGSYFTNSAYTYNYVEWNNYRLPPIHRLDLAMSFTKVKRKHMERTWSVGVYNAYARNNVMLVGLQNDDEGVSLRAYSFLMFIPFVNYQLIF